MTSWTAGVDEALKFMHQVFGMEMLHFGLFTEGTPRDLDGVEQAQYEYTRTLIGMIPETVDTVLDVGCGTGETVKKLIDAGFSPEGLSPDPYQRETFHEKIGRDRRFHLSRFEDFQSDTTYDCVLFSESTPYIDKDLFFPKCLELTGPGSCVVVSDIFQSDSNEHYATCFVERDFRERAGRAGFEIAAHRDITREVLPTLDLSREFLRHGQRILRYGQDSFSRSSPALWKIVKLFFGRKIRVVNSLVFEKLPKRLDSKRFEETMRYAMYRLERR